MIDVIDEPAYEMCFSCHDQMVQNSKCPKCQEPLCLDCIADGRCLSVKCRPLCPDCGERLVLTDGVWMERECPICDQ